MWNSPAERRTHLQSVVFTNLGRRLPTRTYLFLELQMITAPMMPGTQPRMVSTVTITMDPQPLSSTASGGKRMQSTTRQQLMVLSCYSRNVVLPFIRIDIRKSSPNGKGFHHSPFHSIAGCTRRTTPTRKKILSSEPAKINRLSPPEG